MAAIRIDGLAVPLDTPAEFRLIDLLRARGHDIPDAEGGASVVLVDRVPTDAGLVLAALLDGAAVETANTPDPIAATLRASFAAHDAACPRCRGGRIVAGLHLLRINTWITEDEARAALLGHLCRCDGYGPSVAAICEAARLLRDGAPDPDAPPLPPLTPALAARIVLETPVDTAALRSVPGVIDVLVPPDPPPSVTAVILAETDAVACEALRRCVPAPPDAQRTDGARQPGSQLLPDGLAPIILAHPDGHLARSGASAPRLDALALWLAQRADEPVCLALDLDQAMSLCPAAIVEPPAPADAGDDPGRAAARGTARAALGPGPDREALDDLGRLILARDTAAAGSTPGGVVAAAAEVVVDRDTGHAGLARLSLAVPAGAVSARSLQAAAARGLGQALREDPARAADLATLNLPTAFSLPPIDLADLPPDPTLTPGEAARLATAATAAATLASLFRAAGIPPGPAPMTNDRVLAAILAAAPARTEET